MNMTTTIIDRPNYNKRMSTKKETLKDLGIHGYSRLINIFFKENKNTNGIIDHNLVTKIGCLITNKCIFDITVNDLNKKVYQKTVYLCDIEIPSSCSMQTIKDNMNKFIGSAQVIPYYGFSNAVIEGDDGKFVDMGLSMVDLSLVDKSSFGIINFSKDTDERYKDIIYGNEFNPKYYCILDNRANQEYEKDRSGTIDEFVDGSTKIIYNTFGNEKVDNFINNDELTGIYINKRTIAISEFMKSFFSKFLFTCIEEFEFKTETSSSISLIPTNIKTFASFSKDISVYYLTMLTEDTIKQIEILEKELNEPFKLICGISNNFIIIDVYFINDGKRVRITKPMYKMYGEFALSSEDITSEINSQSEYVRENLLEQSVNSPNALANPNSIIELIGYVNSFTNILKTAIESNGDNIRQALGESLIDKHKKLISEDQKRLEDK